MIIVLVFYACSHPESNHFSSPASCSLFASRSFFFFFFFNDTATTEIYTLSLHDALPISPVRTMTGCTGTSTPCRPTARRSEEHTSELQSQSNLVCRLLLEKKKSNPTTSSRTFTRS